MARLFAVPKLLITTLVLAVISGIGAIVATRLMNQVGEGVHLSAYTDNSGIEDFSLASPQVMDRAAVRDLKSDGSSKTSSTSRGRPLKAAVQGIKAVVQTSKSASISIVDMKAVITKRSRVTEGTLLYSTTQGGANTAVGFDLEAANPIAREVVRTPPKLGDSYFGGNHVDIEAGKTQVFQIKGIPGRYTYEWRIDVTIVVDGRREVRSVLDRGPDGRAAGRPFVVTGYARSYHANYRFDDGRWNAISPSLASRLTVLRSPAIR